MEEDCVMKKDKIGKHVRTEQKDTST